MPVNNFSDGFAALATFFAGDMGEFFISRQRDGYVIIDHFILDEGANLIEKGCITFGV